MTDDRMEGIIGNLLRAGVVLAAVVVAAGGAWYLADAANTAADYRQFHPGPGLRHAFRSLTGPQAVILTGLLILVATPVARVAFSLIAFAQERDWLYVWISAAVLATLIYSAGSAWW